MGALILGKLRAAVFSFRRPPDRHAPSTLLREPIRCVDIVPHCQRKSADAHGSLRKLTEAEIGIISAANSNPWVNIRPGTLSSGPTPSTLLSSPQQYMWRRLTITHGGQRNRIEAIGCQNRGNQHRNANFRRIPSQDIWPLAPAHPPATPSKNDDACTPQRYMRRRKPAIAGGRTSALTSDKQGWGLESKLD